MQSVPSHLQNALYAFNAGQCSHERKSSFSFEVSNSDLDVRHKYTGVCVQSFAPTRQVH